MPPKTLIRLARYISARLVTLAAMVVISVFLTTFIANMGGYVDEVIRANTAFAVGMSMRGDEYAQSLTAEERAAYLNETVDAILDAQGMNQPFLLRTVRWVTRALTLDWGRSRMGRIRFAGEYTQDVRAHILDSLPRTLLLFGTANLLLFFTSIGAALMLTHTQNGWLDRIVVVLLPLSSAPPWVYGILLTVLAIQIPWAGLHFITARFDAWPTEFRWSYVILILQHMLLPMLSIFLSKFFQSVFAWRAFFMLHYDEDYVNLAKAKGLPRWMLERRYILRPTLPAVLTNFALLLTSLWQEVIVLEYFFNVQGIGKLFVQALGAFDIPMILAIVVVFAYLLALTVFFLDIAYALVDPRVRIGGDAQFEAPARRRALRWPALPRLRFPDLGALAANIREVGRHLSQSLHRLWRDLARYPSALVGLALIAFMIGVAIYAVIAIPYEEAVVLWRGDQATWYQHPRNAPPVWFDVFTSDLLPRTMLLDSRPAPDREGPSVNKFLAAGSSFIEPQSDEAGSIKREVIVHSPEMTEINLTIPFEYPYDRFPSEMTAYLHTIPVERAPHISLSWRTPDGREIRLGEVIATGEDAYRFAYDDRLLRRLDGVAPEEALFADPAAETLTPLKGEYELHISGLLFEEPMELDVEFIIYGKVHGLAGTDGRRRDLMIAVLWGTGAALAFGLLGAIGATLSTTLLAAIGAWFGGWLDALLQRITEVNMVLPFLPVSLMIFTLYSKSFWVLLGVVVLLSIFGSDLKSFRATFLQTKHALYIEAASAYGASDWRIIFNYMIPHIASVMISKMVILVPSYVFLESALAFLGLSDPVLPTWGKLIYSAFSKNVFVGPYHLILLPGIILMVTGLAFSLVGYALERTLNPRSSKNL